MSVSTMQILKGDFDIAKRNRKAYLKDYAKTIDMYGLFFISMGQKILQACENRHKKAFKQDGKYYIMEVN